MQHPLQNTFHALDTYIQSQKALLARTQSDLDRLRRIRDQAATHPEPFFHSFDEKLNDIAFPLDRQPDIAAEVQDKIDWDLFRCQDPTPFHTLAADLRATHHARSQPSMKQQSALSSAQQLVRTARRTIVEPVLASFELSSDSSDEEPEPAPCERQQIGRIHLRKSGLTVRASGVHILRKMQDEGQDVDIATDGEPLVLAPSSFRACVPHDLAGRCRLVYMQQRQSNVPSKPSSFLSPLSPRRRNQGRRRTNKHGPFQSSTSLSAFSPRFRMVKRIDGPRYQRQWVVAALHVRLPLAYKSILRN